MKKFSVAAVASMIAVFCSGIVVGALGHRLYTVKSVIATADMDKGSRDKPKSAEDYRKKFVDEMQARLKLDDTQLKQLNVILDDTRDQFHAVKQRGKAEMKQIHDAQKERITEILSAPQRAEYEKMIAERDQRRKDREAADKANQDKRP
jgi:capsule polysaccharide export protein KpsE/RkpR